MKQNSGVYISAKNKARIKKAKAKWEASKLVRVQTRTEPWTYSGHAKRRPSTPARNLARQR